MQWRNQYTYKENMRYFEVAYNMYNEETMYTVNLKVDISYNFTG